MALWCTLFNSYYLALREYIRIKENIKLFEFKGKRLFYSLTAIVSDKIDYKSTHEKSDTII